MGKKEPAKLPLTVGHGPGQAVIAYVPAGKETLIVSCGADGNAILREGDTLDELYKCKVDSGPATVLAVSGKHIAVGDEQYVKVRHAQNSQLHIQTL